MENGKKKSVWPTVAFLLSFLATMLLFRYIAEKRMEKAACVYGPPPTDYVEGIGEGNNE